jgi:hypothetical protein
LLRDKRYADFQGVYADAINELIAAVQGHELRRLRPSPSQDVKNTLDSQKRGLPAQTSISTDQQVAVRELRVCASMVANLLQRLHNLQELIDAMREGRLTSGEYRRQQLAECNRVSGSEVRQLDLLCVETLKKLLPEQHKVTEEWFIHKDQGYLVKSDIADFTKKKLQLDMVLATLEDQG